MTAALGQTADGRTFWLYAGDYGYNHPGAQEDYGLRGATSVSTTAVSPSGYVVRASLADGSVVEGHQYGTTPWVPVAAMANITQLECGCGVESNGAVRCWADGCWGTSTPSASLPASVNRIVGDLAITQNGDLYRLSSGQQVPLHNVIDASSEILPVGADFPKPERFCAVTVDSTLYCWGKAPLGDGTLTNHDLPVPIGTGFSSVNCLDVAINCAVRQDGTVVCWGILSNGIGGTEEITSPRAVNGLAHVKQLPLATADGFVALLDDGSVVGAEMPLEAPTVTSLYPKAP